MESADSQVGQASATVAVTVLPLDLLVMMSDLPQYWDWTPVLP